MVFSPLAPQPSDFVINAGFTDGVAVFVPLTVGVMLMEEVTLIVPDTVGVSLTDAASDGETVAVGVNDVLTEFDTVGDDDTVRIMEVDGELVGVLDGVTLMEFDREMERVRDGVRLAASADAISSTAMIATQSVREGVMGAA